MSAGTPRLVSTKFSADQKPTLKGTRIFRVKCTDKTADDAETAALAVGLDIGASWSNRYPGVLARSIEADNGEATGDGGILFLVTVEYSNESLSKTGGDKDSEDPDPRNRPGVLTLAYEQTEETIYQGMDATPTIEDQNGNVLPTTAWIWGNAICNSAGTPFAEGLKETFPDAVYTFSKNIASDQWGQVTDLLDTFVNNINLKDFSVYYRGGYKRFKKETVLLTSPSSEPGCENNIQFETLTVQLRVRKDGWLRKILDQGTRAFAGDPVKAPPAPQIRDGNTDAVTEPVLLNGRGNKLRVSDTDKNSVYLKFRTKGKKNFAGLFPEFG